MAVIEKLCTVCSKTFLDEKSSDTKTCSEPCRLALHKQTKYRNKVCINCGTEVEVPGNNYCSTDCKISYELSHMKGRDEVRFCKTCGRAFVAERHTKTTWCSRECHLNYTKDHPLEYPKTPLKEKHLLVCETCKKQFEVWSYRLKINNTAKYCSRECHYAAKPKATLICQHCGVKFIVQNHRKNSKYCSKSCSQANAKVHRKQNSAAEKALVQFLANNGVDVVTDTKIYISDSYVVPDIICNQKIIEYYGTYWHCDPRKYAPDFYNKSIYMTAQEKWTYDANRLSQLEELGYLVLVVWEQDFKDNPDAVKQKCLQFLTAKETYEENKVQHP